MNEHHPQISQDTLSHFFYIGLRGKLLIATLTLLLLPFAGYFYLIELENYLKNNQLQSQLETSRLMAGFFESSSQLKQSNQLHNGHPSIYAYPLHSKPLIDGYYDDWEKMYLQEQQFTGSKKGTEKFRLLTGVHGEHLYFFLSVNDADIRYKLPQYQQKYDRVQLSFLDKESKQRHDYYIETEAPGWFKAKSVLSANTFNAYQIKGEWQDNKQGYQLEFSLPLNLLGNYFSVTVFDNGIPFSTRNVTSSFNQQLNPVIKESGSLRQHLLNLHNKLSDVRTRIYLINKYAEVIAQAGELKTSNLLYREPDSFITHLNNLYQVLVGLDIKNRRYFGQLSHLSGEEIDQALGKDGNNLKAAASWLAGSNSQTLILSTAATIIDTNNEVIGALVLEKTNAAILALHDQTFERVLIISVLLFIATAMILLVYSGRLVNRILKLQKATEQALTREGKLNPTFPSSDSQDEIGQLSRSFSILMHRLNQYTGYLEGLAGKLSHELRTPLSIIKSSLENMQFQGIQEKNQAFMQRALDGSERLSLILRRMGEASRLEQALQSSEKKKVEMRDFLTSYFEAIQTAHHEITFSVSLPEQSIYCLITPELIAQLLDKLIENAISFHERNTEIAILVRKYKHNELQIDIFNCGPWVEMEQSTTIFDSMVSHRKRLKSNHEDRQKKQLNLGLGLHIARLISDYHNAGLNYINRRQNAKEWKKNGVSFVLGLKIIE